MRRAVLALQDALFPGDPNRLGPEQLARPGADKRVLVLVAELGDEVAGFLVLRDRSARLWTSVDFVGVAPWAASRGVVVAQPVATAAHDLEDEVVGTEPVVAISMPLLSIR